MLQTAIAALEDSENAGREIILVGKAKSAAGSEAAIAEIRDGATKSVTAVAKDTAKAIVASMGGTADAKTITAAVTARMKG